VTGIVGAFQAPCRWAITLDLVAERANHFLVALFLAKGDRFRHCQFTVRGQPCRCLLGRQGAADPPVQPMQLYACTFCFCLSNQCVSTVFTKTYARNVCSKGPVARATALYKCSASAGISEPNKHPTSHTDGLLSLSKSTIHTNFSFSPQQPWTLWRLSFLLFSFQSI
jgi:hypothetical protein